MREHATKLDPVSIAAHNEAVLTRRMRDELAIPRRAALNLTDSDLWNGVALNDLDDWSCLHAQVAQKPAVAR